MEYAFTQILTNGEFTKLPGKPEDHGLAFTASYSFMRDNDQWTIYLAEERPNRPPKSKRKTGVVPSAEPIPRPALAKSQS